MHLEPNLAPGDLLAFPAELDPEGSIEVLDASQLPPAWRGARAQPALRRLGDAWIAPARSLALQVPSAVVPEEANWLINPRHPEFAARFTPGSAMPFRFDGRIWRR